MTSPVIPRRTTIRLMDWFAVHKRDMPWRGDTDPYRIWVSEVMLQQTQVATVIDYFNRWVATFPDVFTLAAADRERVLKLWEGLGYYSRARNLHAGAEFIVNTFGGTFPDDFDSWLAVPGVGPYIAAAVVSIAFNKPAGVVDGNVKRVIARLFALGENAATHAFSQRIKAVVETSFHDFEPGWVNQAWMELGALQCTRTPDCPACPLKESCRAWANRTVSQYPVKPKRDKTPRRAGAMFIVRRRGKILFVRRPDTGLLGGLWELPNLMFDETEQDEFLAETGITLSSAEPLFVVHHTYSHFKVAFSVYDGMLAGRWKSDRWPTHRWYHVDDVAGIPRPAVTIKALKKCGMA